MYSPKGIGPTLLLVALLSTAASIVGCSSGSTGTMSNPLGAAAGTAPFLFTVSDAPLANVLSASVTLSSVTLSTGTAGSAVSVLPNPATIELSSLAGIQEPLELENIAAATYTSATVTVSAAQVTYLNASGVVTTSAATISQPTITVALSPAMTVATSGEVHLDLGFNLATSFDLTGTTLTFTPAISTAAAAVSAEAGGDRQLEVVGSVVSVSANTIVVQGMDSGNQFTYAIDSATVLPAGLTPASIAVGSIVQLQAQIQADGTLLAMSITPQSSESMSNQSGSSSGGGDGLIVSVTTVGGQVTGFTMVPREHFDGSTATTLAVSLSPSTVYAIDQDALALGLTSAEFTNAQLFPGQSVSVSGTNTGGTVAATQVTLSPESLSGTLAAIPTGTSFSLALPTGSYLTTYDALTSLSVVTGTATSFDYQLTAAMFIALPAATSVEVNGYLLQTAPGIFTLYAENVGQTQAAETPEAPEGGG